MLSAIVDAHTPMDALTDDQHGHPTYLALDGRDRSLVRAILMAVLRHRGDLEATISTYTARPLPEGAHSLRAILHVAAAQIFFLDVPAHSAVDLAVESANRDPRNRKFASLINAVTRRMVREKDERLALFSSAPSFAPAWFHDRLRDVYGNDAASEIARMHAVPAPLDITLKEPTDPIGDALLEAGGGLRVGVQTVRLSGKLDVTSLPGFAEGHWWVQDYAASIPALLFGNIAGKKVLDLCAAPGGKTAQLLATCAHVTALEKSSNRAKRLEQNLKRVGLVDRCEIVVTDMFKFDQQAAFDCVLLDAPCSSTGTVRRHPDVPWTKTPEDIAKLADLQRRMLEHASGHVASGGTLVFSNCSLDPDEGEVVAQAFADDHAGDFVVDPVTSDEVPAEMIDGHGFVRTTPAHMPHDNPSFAGMDGFFAARFRKR